MTKLVGFTQPLSVWPRPIVQPGFCGDEASAGVPHERSEGSEQTQAQQILVKELSTKVRCARTGRGRVEFSLKENGRRYVSSLVDSQRDELLPTRPSLLSRLKDLDDQESWRDFFDSYWNLIYRMALRSGLTESEAQDVVQETVITVSKNIQQFQYDPARGSFKGWLLQTTRWKIMDEFRKRAKLPAQNAPPDADNARRTDLIERVPDPAGHDFDKAYEEEWQKNLWNAALERVRRSARPKQFQIFDLYILQGWPVEKVKATLKVSTAQVYLARLRIGARIKQEVKTLERQAGSAA